MTSVNEAASALATTFSGQLLEPGDTEDQQPTVKGAPFQPQSSGFNEVNRRNLSALSKQSFISSERSSLYCLFVETQHGSLIFLKNVFGDQRPGHHRRPAHIESQMR
jgi:hypothetical protein